MTTIDARIRDKINGWSDELLQLDRRNRLLYFRHVKVGSIKIDATPVHVLNAITASRGVTFVEGLPTEDGDDLPTPGPRALVAANKNRADLPRALKNLATSASAMYMERGVWNLYLGLGMLHWVDSDDKPVSSPLLLVPVALKRDSSSSGYRLTTADEDAVFNPTLLHHLTTTYRMSFEPDVDADYDSLAAQVRGLVAAKPDWYVVDEVVLSAFSFHKEAMYKDLRDNIATVSSHPIVQMLAVGADAPSSTSLGFEKFDLRRLDSVAAPEDVPTILDADATQMRCILHAREGRSFVMDGPPGTGKSQTIANMIATLIADGRTVLFVSEKMAALEVVRNRLDANGLGDFVLELHSHKATRKEVAQTLGKALKVRPRAKPQHRSPKTDVAAMRTRLDAFADALNDENTSLGMSLFRALGELNRLHEFQAYAVDDAPDWNVLTDDRFLAIDELARQLSNAWDPVEEDVWVWRDMARSDRSAAEIRQVQELVSKARRDAADLEHLVAAIDADFGWQWGGRDSDVERRVQLLRMLQQGVSVPAHWLTTDDLTPVSARADVLRRSIEAYLTADQRLKSAVGHDWGAIDGTAVGKVQGVVDELASGEHGARDITSATAAQLTGQAESLRLVADALEVADTNAAGLARSFGMELGSEISLDETRRLATLGSLATAPARPDAAWLNPTFQRAVVESNRVLGELVSLVRDRQESLSQVFTSAVLELDLASMHQRFKHLHTGIRRWSSAARRDRKALAGATVLGKANRETIARLDEAVTWQELERRLGQAEHEHAQWLGDRYRRTDTDFDRLGQAIDIACQAVELAGEHLNVQALAHQLSVTGDPDVDLDSRTRRVQHAVEEIALPQLQSTVSADVTNKLATTSVSAIVTWCREGADARERVAAEIAKIDAIAGRAMTVEDGISILRDAVAADDALRLLLEQPEADQELLGDRYTVLDTDWSAWDNAFTWATSVRSLVADSIDERCAARLLRPSFATSDVSDAHAMWVRGRQGIESLFAEPYADDIRSQLADVAAARDLLAALDDDAIEKITTWQRYIDLTTKLTELGLSEAIGRAMTTRLSRDRLVDAIHHAVLQAWLSCQMTSPKLDPLDALSRDDLVERYRTNDSLVVSNAYVDVVNACGSRRPTSSVGQPGLIARQGNLKARHLPIRDLMAQAGQTAQLLKPCFMMSPLSVSQYLPSSMHFDVVIFDEASQVMPSDAINCVYRGTQLIVAGDVKQLPPTRFFARQIEGGEDEAFEDGGDAGEFESVLDLAKGSTGIQTLPLQWHYRSRHEALIAFSNQQFYDGDLRTFPGAFAKAPDQGVVGIKVDGVYERGGAKHNVVEAEEVVDRVLHHTRVHPTLSIGVVAFSSEQASAITAALERRATTHPEIAGILDTTDRLEGFFVKNLENVQGDERDIIIFSIGYGRDESGRLMMNFGPLNRDGGWRRLNVAITRARRRVEVVTSITAYEPEFERAKANKAVSALRSYLAYALNGNTQEQGGRRASRRPDANSPLGDVIAAALEGHGYEVDRNVGMASVTVDVAVKNPDNEGHYIVGVLTDGPEYAEVGATRDRERLQPDVLQQLGWRLHRAWSHAWYTNREREVARLLALVEDAYVGNTSDALAAASPSHDDNSSREIAYSDVDLAALPSWAQPYKVGTGLVRGWWDATKPGSRVALREYLESVIATESPIHIDLLTQRVRDDWAHGRASAALRQAVVDALRTSHQVMVDSDDFAWWPETVVAPRYPAGSDEPRSVRFVHQSEIEAVLVNLVRDAGSVAVDDVVLAAARLFGWKRTGPDIRSAFERAIQAALAAGTLRHENGYLTNATGRPTGTS